MNRSSDPLTAAMTSILKPAISPLEFQKLGTRSFGRVSDGVLQYLDLQLSAWGSKDFAVNYAAITLHSPRDFIALASGGRLPRGKSGDGWWKSETHEFADASMRDVVERFAAHCVPWFERTRSTRGLLAVLLEQHAAFDRPHGHTLFDMGCCQAHLGETGMASDSLERAIVAYRDIHQGLPQATWCLDGVARCERLLMAIREERHTSQLAEWFAHSVRSLKLAKILGE